MKLVKTEKNIGICCNVDQASEKTEHENYFTVLFNLYLLISKLIPKI